MADSLKLNPEWFRDFEETGGTPTTWDTIPRASSRRRQQQSRGSGAPSVARGVEDLAAKGPFSGYGGYVRQELDRAANAPPPAWMNDNMRQGHAFGQDVARLLLELLTGSVGTLPSTRPTPPPVPPLPTTLPPPPGSGYYP